MGFSHILRRHVLGKQSLAVNYVSVHLRLCSSSVPQDKRKQDLQIIYKMDEKPKYSFAKNIFRGTFDVGLLTFPEVLEVERLQSLEDLIMPIEECVSEVDSTLIDDSASIPEKVMADLKQLGMFGTQIPVEYGGLGLNASEYARVGEITSQDGSISAMLAAHQVAGLKGLLLAGSDDQKQRYLPRLARGEWIAASCLEELDSETRATLSEDRKTWYLNGAKKWITNGGLANIFTVVAKTQVEDHLGNKQDTYTAFLVEREFEGVSTGNSDHKSGLKGSNMCEVHFKNTPVPVQNVLGEVGLGFKLIMDILHSSQFCIGSSIAGILKKLIRLTTSYVGEKKHGGKLMRDFDLIHKKLAKIICRTYAVESMTYLTAAMIDINEDHDHSLEAAIVKVFCCENLSYSIRECQQIFGPMGYMKGYHYERILRDATVSSISDRNDIFRMFIAVSGVQHAGLMLKETVEKLRNPLMNPGFLFKRVFERRNHANDTPKLVLGLDNYVHPSLQNSAKQLEYCVLRLQYVVELLLIRYGQEVTEHQIELNRLADIAMFIYAMTAVIGRASRSYCIGLQDSDYEVLVAATFCESAFQRVKTYVKEIEVGPIMNSDINYKKIAQKLYEKEGYFLQHPLSRNF